MYDNIFIWSNGNQYKSLEEYGEKLHDSKIDFNSNSLNVFINTCVPLVACCDRFIGHDCISVHCGVPKTTTIHCLFGFDEMMKYKNYLRDSYVLYINPYRLERVITKLKRDVEFDVDDLKNEIFFKIDES